MAKFLNTTGATYHLEELIKNSSDRLILISPYIKLNDRIKELLEDKNRLKIDVRIIYRDNDLNDKDKMWLSNLNFIRVSFCPSLHAKCYLSENECIITSLNLYEFSQINNNEMGVLIDKYQDSQLYADTYDEVQRIVRISEEIDINQTSDPRSFHSPQSKPAQAKNFDKITIKKLAEKLNISPDDLKQKLEQLGYIAVENGKTRLTDKGRQAGGELRKGQYGYFIVWSVDLDISWQDNESVNTTLAEKLLSLFKF